MNDIDTIRAVLLDWRAAGEKSPTIPVYRDEDGDGIPDFYGLDENDHPVLISGTLAASVAEAHGYGVEGASGE